MSKRKQRSKKPKEKQKNQQDQKNQEKTIQFPHFPIANMQFKVVKNKTGLRKLLDHKCHKAGYNKTLFRIVQQTNQNQNLLSVGCTFNCNCPFYMKFKSKNQDFQINCNNNKETLIKKQNQLLKKQNETLEQKQLQIEKQQLNNTNIQQQQKSQSYKKSNKKSKKSNFKLNIPIQILYYLIQYQTQHNHKIQRAYDQMFGQFVKMDQDNIDMKQIKKILQKKYDITIAQFDYMKRKIQHRKKIQILEKQKNCKNDCNNLKSVFIKQSFNVVRTLKYNEQFKVFMKSFLDKGEILKIIPDYTKQIKENKQNQTSAQKQKQRQQQMIQENSQKSQKQIKIVLQITHEMKQNYIKFNQCVSLILLKDIISTYAQKTQEKDDKKWIFGLFAGMNNKNNWVIFAITIFQETKQFFQDMFKLFFKMVNRMLPQTLLIQFESKIQDQYYIEQIIQNFKKQGIFNGQIGYLSQSVLEKVEPFNRKKQFYKQLLKARDYIRNQEVYQKTLQQCQKNCYNVQTYLKVLKNWKIASQKFLYQKIPFSFVGISQPSQKIYSYFQKIKQKLNSKNSPLQILKYFSKQISKIKDLPTQYCQTNYENSYNDKGINQIRKQFSNDVVQFFMLNYIFSSDLDIEKVSDEFYKTFSKNDDKTNQRIFYELHCSSQRKLKNNQRISIEKWTCSCQQIKKTGIPCCHIIRIQLQRKTKNYINYFHSRWFLTQKYHTQIKYQFSKQNQLIKRQMFKMEIQSRFDNDFQLQEQYQKQKQQQNKVQNVNTIINENQNIMSDNTTQVKLQEIKEKQ